MPTKSAQSALGVASSPTSAITRLAANHRNDTTVSVPPTASLGAYGAHARASPTAQAGRPSRASDTTTIAP